MSGRATEAPPRTGRRRRHTSPDEMVAALGPVTAALASAADRTATEVRTAAAAEVEAMVAEARAEAESLLAAASADATQAAQRVAAQRRAAARREAHERVLRARRTAFERLRAAAVDAVERHGCTAQGEVLAERLRGELALATGRGSGVVLEQGRPFSLSVTLGNRRAYVDAALLVDEAIGLLGLEVERLWT